MTRRPVLVALAALAVLLSGCGAVDEPVPDAAETAQATPSASASPTASPSVTPTAEITTEPTPAPAAEPPAPEPQPVAEPAPEPEPEPEPAPEPAPAPPPALVAGPPIWSIGSSGDDVREVQARLRQIQWFTRDPTGYYGDVTAHAVSGFQAKRGIPVNGYVDRRTWDRLVAMTREPSRDELYPPPPEPEPVAVAAPAPSVDSRCLSGRVICIDKSQSVVRWVVDGNVQLTLDARFGSELTPTREGVFSVQNKVRDEYSRLYDNAPMPLAVYFSGGQAVHYSPDFAARGYNGSSHGCVNTRSWDGMSYLFSSARVGDRVVVYWS